MGWRIEDGHGDVVATGGAVVEGCRVTTGDGGGRVTGINTRVGSIGAGHGAEVGHDFGVVAGDSASDAVGEGQDHEDEGDNEAGGGDGGAAVFVTQGW